MVGGCGRCSVLSNPSKYGPAAGSNMARLDSVRILVAPPVDTMSRAPGSSFWGGAVSPTPSHGSVVDRGPCGYFNSTLLMDLGQDGSAWLLLMTGWS